MCPCRYSRLRLLQTLCTFLVDSIVRLTQVRKFYRVYFKLNEEYMAAVDATMDVLAHRLGTILIQVFGADPKSNFDLLIDAEMFRILKMDIPLVSLP